MRVHRLAEVRDPHLHALFGFGNDRGHGTGGDGRGLEQIGQCFHALDHMVLHPPEPHVLAHGCKKILCHGLDGSLLVLRDETQAYTLSCDTFVGGRLIFPQRHGQM
ncbi:hypothetical protein D3C72_1679630 [compost metagenome]